MSYTIAYANHGSETAPDVVVDLTAFDALSFGGSGTLAVNLGDVGPGVSGTVTITADVNAAGGLAAELDATLADGPHGAYEWAWLHNRVDADPPQVEIVCPDPIATSGPAARSSMACHGMSRACPWSSCVPARCPVRPRPWSPVPMPRPRMGCGVVPGTLAT